MLDLLQQIPGAVGVLDIGGMDDDAQQQAQGIDRDMALASLDLLGSIVAARPPFSVSVARATSGKFSNKLALSVACTKRRRSLSCLNHSLKDAPAGWIISRLGVRAG